MEHPPDLSKTDGYGDGRKATALTSTSCGSGGSGHRLSGRQASIHQCMGGGKLADVLLWKQWHISFGAIVVATVVWLLLEWTGLSILSICSDVLLILIIISFLHANYATLRNKQPLTLPDLVLSEEMVNSTAASLRVKINYLLLMAHDISIGKDFRVFFKVVVGVWLLSVIGSFSSFFTLAYMGTLVLMSFPALYSKYGDHVDKCCGMIQRQFSKHYRIIDESVLSRRPRNMAKDKDS